MVARFLRVVLPALALLGRAPASAAEADGTPLQEEFRLPETAPP